MTKYKLKRLNLPGGGYRYIRYPILCGHSTAHNWQKCKSTFLKYPCHKIYRVEEVGLKVPIILTKLRFRENVNVKFGAIL